MKINKDLKVSKDFFDKMATLDKRMKIISYLLDPNNRHGKNLAIGTHRKIAEVTELSHSTVQSFLKKLEEQGLIKRYSNGVYELTMEKVTAKV